MLQGFADTVNGYQAKRVPKRSTMRLPMLSEAVAAGEGAFSPFTTRAQVWAGTPAGPIEKFGFNLGHPALQGADEGGLRMKRRQQP